MNHCGLRGLDRSGLPSSGGLAVGHLADKNFSVMHRKICFVINIFNVGEAKSVEGVTYNE